jgi:hypothetical protein
MRLFVKINLRKVATVKYITAGRLMKEKNNVPQRMEDLTIEDVKSCRLFTHFTDEQALEVVAALKRFTAITYNLFEKRTAGNCRNA